MIDYSKLFNPQSVVVIGASNTPDKLGGIVMNNLTKSKYSGSIYPINPNSEKIFGIPAIKNLSSLPKTADLAIIALNASSAVEALEDVGKNQIPFAIIFAGGFTEVGETNLENKLLQICKQYGTRLIGPNCMGIWTPNLNASFMNILPQFPGKVTFISQSGSLIAFAIYLKLRLGKFVSLGNSTDITFEDLFDYLSTDKNTKVLTLYIESLKNGRKFLEKLKGFSKPILAIKAGSSDYGQRSIASHTGALAGKIELYKHLFKAYGILSVNSFEMLVTGARILELSSPMKNNKVVALSNAGGAVCLFSDALADFGLNPEQLPKSLETKLFDLFPPQAPVNNPLDLTVTGGTASNVLKVMDLLFDTSLHDYGAIVYIPVVAPFIDPKIEANLVIKLHKKSPLPFIACLLAGDKVRPIINLLDIAEVPYTETIGDTAEALQLLWSWSKRN